MSLTCRIAFLGCKVNQYESDRFLAEFARYGVTPARPGYRADIAVVNTCTVTAVSDKKSRQLIRRMADSAGFLVVTGCYAELTPELAARFSEVDLVVSNDDKEALVDRVAEHLGLSPGDAEPVGAAGAHSRALLKVQDGCDSGCTYCTIPQARGRPRSRPLDQAVAEARALAASGSREIVLTGVHLGKYGLERGGGPVLVELLEELLSSTRKVRFRLSSLEPGELSDELLALLAGEPRICPHLHLPLQSGSDSVLARMGRPYTGAEYLKTVRRVRTRVPAVALTTDLIVGFPGESEADFEATQELVAKARFTRLHVFPFSPRPLAPASAFDDPVESAMKEQRAGRLRALGEELARDYRRGFVGTQLNVVVEDVVQHGGKSYLAGTSENYLRVLLPHQPDRVRELITVVVDAEQGEFLLAKMEE